MHPIVIVFAGLAFDVAGAVVRAKGFIFKRWDDALIEALTMVIILLANPRISYARLHGPAPV